MKKLISVLLSVIMILSIFTIVPFSAMAAETSTKNTGAKSGTTGDCTWILVGTKLTISGNGAMSDYSSSNPPWCGYSDSIVEVKIENGVTSIGERAFIGCKGLTSITIPNSVTSIGRSAFSGCTGLTSVTIPDSVTSIGEYAFFGCKGLTSITIPNSVTSIGQYVFSGCTGLESINVSKDNTVYDSRDNCYAIIETKTNSLVVGCKNTTIPDSVTSIGYGAFFNCAGLTSITIPNSVTSIGEGAFSGCTGLTSITIPNSVTSIGGYAFGGCTGLMSVTIPDSVTSIGENAFDGCTSLTSVTIPKSVTNISDKAFGYYKDEEGNYKKLEGFTIYGYEGSAADDYAWNNNFDFVKLTEKTDDSSGISLELTDGDEISVTDFTEQQADDIAKDLPEGFTAKAVYDIGATKNGSAVQPEYVVNMKIPCDNEKAKVYFKETDGSLTDVKAVYKNGNLEFSTTQFGVFVVAEEKPATEPTEPTTEAQETTHNQTNVWTVAGNLPVLGGDWDPTNMANALTEAENNIWHIRWLHVPKGEYEFKITNGTWDEAYGLGSDHFYVRIAEDESDLTIKFNADTKEITVEGTNVTTKRPVVEIVPGYYVTGSKGLCGKDWVNKDDPNTLMFKGEDGSYYKDFTNIAAGSYEFKVIYVNASGRVIWHPGGMGNDSVVNVKTDGSLVRVSYTSDVPAEREGEDGQGAGVATVYADPSQAPEIKPYVEPATVPTEATEPTTAEQEIVKGKNNADIREAVPSEIKTKTLYFYMPQEWRNTYNDTYDGNSLDSCSAGIYWWEGPYNANDYSNGWPGYNITERDHSDNNIFVARVPVDLGTVIFNNTVDGGSVSDRENEPERYAAALQTDTITAEYYMPNEDGYGFYPIGTEDCDGMIYVCNLKDTQVNPFSEKRTYKGAWFYYYGNGKYGKYKTLEQAKMYNAVYSGGQWPGDPHHTEPPTETVEPTTVVTQPATEATEPTTNTTESTEPITEPITEATEPATTVPVETRTFNFLPDSELAKSADSFKLVIQDTKNNMHTYDFVATGIKIDGVKIYTANVPVDFDIAQVQYQMYKGETWLGQMVKSASEISEIGESIVGADGTIINTNEPSTEPTEPATKETEATEPTSTEPAETQPATDKPTEPDVTEPTQPGKKDISSWTVNGIVNKTYTGKLVEQNFYVVSSEGERAKFKASYRNNKEVGTATVIIVGIGDYTGTITKTFRITKADNPVVVKTAAKTVKLKKLKKKNQVVKAITVKNAQGSVTYKLVKKGITKKIRKFVKINSKGVITIKKWKKAKKGKYTIAVKITVKGNSKYKPKTIKKTVKITIN